MEQVYYLFSKSDKALENLESLYICENGEYIDFPAVKTGVYPLGTFLSRIIRILSPWAKSDFNPFKQESIYKLNNKLSEQESSFLSAADGDKNVIHVMHKLLVKTYEYYNFKNASQILKTFFNYLELCEKDVYYCFTDYLEILANHCGYKLPSYSLYSINGKNQNKTLSKEEIKYIISNIADDRVAYDPIIKQSKPKQLFKIDIEEPTIKSFGTLQTPIQVFRIDNIIDLIATSLKCIYGQGFVVRRCGYCNNIFITHNKKRKYCPNNTNSKKSCYDSHKLEEQLKREKINEYYNTNKKIRTAMLIKFDKNEPCYREFKRLCKVKKSEILEGKIAETEVIEWMNQYWDEIKISEKNKKKAEKLKK